jgi:long-chain acyl-CoA synthetase
MGCPVLQGYGLTETTACATITEISELSTEAVGPPNQGMQIKLINWEEGNYRVTDQPNPRGEVVIGGNAVAEGYANFHCILGKRALLCAGKVQLHFCQQQPWIA